MLQVQAGRSGVGRQEDPAGRIVAELLDQRRTLLAGNRAVKADMADAARFQPADQDVVRARPLAEHDGLGLRLGKQVVEQVGQLVGLDAMIALPVEQVGAVARHAHVLQTAGQAPLVLVGEKFHPSPAIDDLRHGVGIFLMQQHLRLGHWHQQVLIGPRRQLLQDFGFPAPDHHRRQGFADALQVAVTGHPAELVLDLVVVQQFPGRPEAMLVDELDDGNQLFQLVFQRRPGQHHGVGAVDALQGAGGDGVPVLDPLRFVDDDQVGRPGGDQVEVGLEFFVIGDLAEIVQRVILLALHPAAAHYPRLAPGKTGDFALPLVFQRSRADHQHLRHAEMPRQDFRRGDGLDGLAQAHVIADQGASGAHREQRALGLVGIKRHLEQLLQAAIGRAARKVFGKQRRPPLGIAATGDEIQRIVVSPQFMAGFVDQPEKTLERIETRGRQTPVIGGLEQGARRLLDGGRASRSGTEMHAAPAVVAQMDCRKRRRIAAGKSRLHPALFLQRRQREFDVLAGAQFVGRVIRATAKIVSRLRAANRHPVGAF